MLVVGYVTGFISSVVLTFVGAMAPEPDSSWISLLADATGPTLMAIIIIGALREWWIPGATHKRAIQERDDLLGIVINAQRGAERALNIAERDRTRFGSDFGKGVMPS